MTRMLFVYGDLRHGGIETLIVRLANYLARQGRPIALCIPGGELVDQIGEGVERLLWSDRRDAVGKATAWLARSSEPVNMVSFDPISAALGLAIEVGNAGKVQLVHLSGVYHPRAFFMTGERPDRRLLNRLVARAVGDPSIFYMNAECRDEHARRWGTHLGDCRVIPLPIEEKPGKWRARKSGKLRVVSVGRLVDFKTYNLGAAEIVRQCGRRDVGVQWDIYGTGPLKGAVEQAIASRGVTGKVQLKGRLPYERFETVVAAYDLFVGMGTAALEAAMIGVPTIVATESELRRSYGFVHDLPFGNVGERQAHPPPHDIGDLIRDFASAGEAERKALSAKCRAAVRGYSYDHCIAELDALASAVRGGPSMAFKKLVSVLYEALTDSAAARLVRQILAFARS